MATGRILLLFAIFIGSISYLGFVPQQSDFEKIIISYSIAFLSYFFLVFRQNTVSNFNLLIVLTFISRLILLFSFPNLSDDIYRFIWDGRCMHSGISPFQYLPSDIIGQYNGLTKDLYGHLNSPHYYSIYPPVGQLVSYMATLPFICSYYESAIVFKVFILMAEIGSFILGLRLLKFLNLPKERIFIYTLNPLILIELVGNIHFEAFMVFFLLGTIFLLVKNDIVQSSISFGFAVSSKLLPIMFVPLLLAKMKGFKSLINYGIIAISVTSLCFLPLLNNEIIKNIKSSIGLYVNKFEFNASVYYILREIGFMIKGFNTIHIIGPFLSVLTVLLISIQALIYFKKSEKNKNFILFFFMAFCTYLFLATIVHPWYLSVPLVLCIFTSYRFPVLWSALIFLTYSNYNDSQYFENLWVVLVEYSIVIGYMVYEIRSKGGGSL
ncbi:MAG: hypothetical protein V3V00_11825 [Saprospiraceae bacterium]